MQRLTSLSIEDTRKVSSQYIRDEEAGMLREPRLISEGGRGFSAPFFFGAILNAKSDKIRLGIMKSAG